MPTLCLHDSPPFFFLQRYILTFSVCLSLFPPSEAIIYRIIIIEKIKNPLCHISPSIVVPPLAALILRQGKEIEVN